MKSQGLKFNYGKIIEFLVKEESKVVGLKSLIKNMLGLEKNNCQAITEFYKEISDSASKLSNKQILKLVTGFTIHQTQKQFSQSFDTMMNQKGLIWIDTAAQLLKANIQKLKRLENQKGTIKNEQIIQYKGQLQVDILKVNKIQQSIINLIAQLNIKNNCSMIEEITNKMQRQLEKKKKSAQKL